MINDTASPRKSTDVEPILDHLVDEITARLHLGEVVDVDDYARDHPACADRLRRLFPTLQAMADFGHSIGRTDTATSSQHVPPSALGDFRIIREIGRGGMGVVYEAEQISLGRRVALKVLPFAAVLDKRQLQRFKNEAQAAASLHHTNIVPVFSVGCERGVHYYAMQYVEGQTLSETISQLWQMAGKDSHSAGKTSAGDRHIADSLLSGEFSVAKKDSSDLTTDAFRKATGKYISSANSRNGLLISSVTNEKSLRGSAYHRSIAHLGIQAAEALDYAHHQGLVHRDVKPSNLILDSEGKLWITDFGLVQVATSETLTMAGDLVGTLRYMSPEQIRADHGLVSQRTDIYSLGATLYELLSLEPAFGGNDRQQLLGQIASEEPRPLRRQSKAIPAELETIVMKAMAKIPAERYATAKELANDLTRFLDDLPIRARRPTLVQRVAKWSRRHRTVLTTAIVALIFAAILGAALLWRERAKTLAALDTAQKNYLSAISQRERAEKNFRKAREAVDRMLTRVGEQMADVPHTVALRKAMFEDALAFYLDFLEDHRDDPSVRYETARAYLRIANIAEQLQLVDRVNEICLDAILLLEQLAAEFPSEPNYRRLLADTQRMLGRTRYKIASPGEAETELRKALQLNASLVNRFPKEPVYREALAVSHVQLGTVVCGDGNDPNRYEEGLAEMRLGVEILEKLAYHSASPHIRKQLAESQRTLAFRLQSTGRFHEAEKLLRSTVAKYTALVDEFPYGYGYRRGLASAHFNLGALFLDSGWPAKAVESVRRSTSLRKMLSADYPGIPPLQGKLNLSMEILGEALIQAGQAAEAEDVLRQCLAAREKLINEQPEYHIERRGHLSWAHHELGLVLQSEGRFKEAEQEFRRAVDLRRDLLAGHPSNELYQRFLAWGHFELGVLLHEMQRYDEAHDAFRKAINLLEAAMDRTNPTSTTKTWLIWIFADCPDGRLRNAPKAVKLAEGIRNQIPSSPKVWNLLGVAYFRADQFEDAIEAIKKSSHLRSADVQFQPHAEWLFLAMSYWQLGNKEEAHHWYERTMAWIERNQINTDYHELRRWLPEARSLLQSAERSAQFETADKRFESD